MHCICVKMKSEILKVACITMDANKKSCFFDGLTLGALWGGLCVQALLLAFSGCNMLLLIQTVFHAST